MQQPSNNSSKETSNQLDPRRYLGLSVALLSGAGLQERSLELRRERNRDLKEMR